MRRISRSFGSALVLGGVIIFGGTLIVRHSPTQSTCLEFDAEQLGTLSVPVGSEQQVSFVVSNPCNHPVRIVGIGATCGMNGCIERFDPVTCTLDAGEKRAISAVFKSPREPGPIDLEFTVHYASDKTQQHSVVVQGTAFDTP